MNSQEIKYRCQIVVHDLDTSFRSTHQFEQKTQEYKDYSGSDYGVLGFPLISLIAQVTCKGNDNTEAVVADIENTRVFWSMEELIKPQQ